MDDVTALGIMIRVGTPEADVRAAAKAAEDAGCGCVWINNPPGQDGITPAAWAVGATARTATGTGVVPISHHAPDEILRRVEGLRLPPERYRLGVGSGQGAHPVDRVRAALRELRAAATGHELVAGALGPRMCALAGEEADAVLFNAMTPEYARHSAVLARAAADAAGRGAPRIYAGVAVAMGAAEAARLERASAFYARLPAYVAHFERMGATAADASIAARDVGELAERLAAWRGVVDEVTVIGPPGPEGLEDLLRRLEFLRAAWPASSAGE